jgi:hypothetical protein
MKLSCRWRAWRNVTAGAVAAASLAAGTSAQPFIGQNFTASRSDVEMLRPDVSGAAGADYFVELSGGRYSVYRKSDGVRVQTSDMETFWANAGAPHSGIRAADPRVLYDPYAKRWYAVSIDIAALPAPAVSNNLLFAVSNSANPTAGWTGFKIDSDSNDDHWADFPMIGFNRDVVTLSANMYLLNSSSQPSLNTFVILPKNDLLSGTRTVANAKKFEEFANTVTGFGVQPAVDLDNGSLPLPMLSIQLNGAGTSLNRVEGTSSMPSVITQAGATVLTPTSVAPPSADQPGPKANLFTFDLRGSSTVVKNNGELWAVNCVNSGGRAALRWYRINANTSALIESGYITDPSMAYFYPSIAVNNLGDVVIGMSGTAPETAADPDGTYASAFAVAGKTDPTSHLTTFGAPFITKEGQGDYQVLDASGRNRWGDYSATTNDPADPSIFWTIQAYAYKTDARATQATEIIIRQPNEVRWKDPADGDSDVNANWLGGVAPAPASHVIFSRATDPAGPGYIVNVPSNTAVDRLSVRQGKVTLNLNGAIVRATNTSLATPSIAIGEFGGAPTLSIVDGTVAGVHATLAATPLASATVNLDHARLQLDGNLSVGGTDAVAGGEAVLNVDANSSVQVGQSLRVWGGGVVNFNDGAISAGRLAVSGGRVNIAPGERLKVLRTTDVEVSDGGQIDLTTNAMIVDYQPGNSPLATVRAAIVSGYNGGTWTGPGIMTSAAAGNRAVGYAQARDLLGPAGGIFLGQTVDGDAILLRCTLPGDANLDGAVAFEDLVALAQNYNTGDGSAVWDMGDFTDDGNVDFADLVALAQNYNTTLPTPAQLDAMGAGATFREDVMAASAVVPEPRSIWLIGTAAGLATLGSRQRRPRCDRACQERCERRLIELSHRRRNPRSHNKKALDVLVEGLCKSG